MLLRVLRQFATIIAKELAGRHAAEVLLQPGRLLFPKRLHELRGMEPEAPDGLSLEYLQIAATRNAAAWQNVEIDSAVLSLAAQVSDEIGRAVLLERRIAERLR